MKYYKKIVGDKCYLSPVNIQDADKYTEWLNDLEISSTLQITHQILNEEIEKEILTKLSKENLFAIVDVKTDELIGGCGFVSVDQLNRNAEFGVFVGNKDYWGKGYGTEATNLTLVFGFNVLNLNNIMLKVYSYNDRAVKCYEKCGFKEIGRRRKSRIISGKEYDEMYMDILASEFKNSVIKKYFAALS
jgi:RimJ/RimL family protein N-acetyltransferase